MIARSTRQRLFSLYSVRMYSYHDTAIRAERLVKGTDHCASRGEVFELRKLVNDRGLATDPRDPESLFDRREGETVIYAVSDEFVVHIGFDGVRGSPDAVKHETLFHNANVRAAGEVVFRAGRVLELNDRSGSYGTYGMLFADPELGEAVLKAFERSGVRMSSAVSKLLRKLGKKR